MREAIVRLWGESGHFDQATDKLRHSRFSSHKPPVRSRATSRWAGTGISCRSGMRPMSAVRRRACRSQKLPFGG